MKMCFCVLVAMLVASGCKKVLNEDGFSVVVPDSVKIEKQSPLEDFSLYVFSTNGKPFLSAYAGNDPSFPPEQVTGNTKVRKIDKTVNGRTCQVCEVTDVDGRIYTHMLVRLRSSGCPMYLHFWYSNTSAAEVSRAKAIISSIEPKCVQ